MRTSHMREPVRLPYLAKIAMEQQFPTSPTAPIASTSSPSVSQGNQANSSSSAGAASEGGGGGDVEEEGKKVASGEELIFLSLSVCLRWCFNGFCWWYFSS